MFLTISQIIAKLEELRSQTSDKELPVFVEVDFADESIMRYRMAISDIVKDEISSSDDSSNDLCAIIQI